MTPGACVLAQPVVTWPSILWPLSAMTDPLPAVELAPRSVRTGARQALARWDLADAVDVIDLVATELATNAVRASAPMRLAGQAPVIRVCLLTDRLTARVEVWDEAPGLPVLHDAGVDAESGRGLVLVNNLTGGAWGWSQVAALLPAKCVWAEVPLAAGPLPGLVEGAGCSIPPGPIPEGGRSLLPTGEQPPQGAELSLLPAVAGG
jgi:Histidine kinase-like ATPase domain